jgi:Fe2+ or Zn2+ uptake regulation protein
MTSEVDDVVVGALREAGRKITPQRLELARLIAAAPGPLSQSDVAEVAKEGSPFLDYSTVVRTLRLLVELRLVAERRRHDGKTRCLAAFSSC